ncbi:hypothetical protein [Silanimonas sp.]|jgi:hypothetical protein|uniref:hypothetical protein n=1 Tax=Silanimonas sp. TaxID=1929290 RepID=UPI0037CAF285
MPTELLFYGQIASVVIFLGALFAVYRSLAAQKDATIQALKEQLELLKLQLANAQAQTPDIAVDLLSKRVKSISDELARLNQDNLASAEQIQGKERDLESAKSEMAALRAQIARAEQLFSEFSCPKCKAPMLTRNYHYECVEYGGREIDVDHEVVVYSCGLELVDGEEATPCGSR